LPTDNNREVDVKKILELVLCILHPIAVVLIWINLLGRDDIGFIAKLAWGIAAIVPCVPFLYVLTSNNILSPSGAYSDRTGTRAAVCTYFGDPARGDLDTRRDVAPLEQLDEHRLALRLDARSQRLIERLRPQRAGDLNVDMQFRAAVLNLPAVHVAHARDLDRCRSANDLGVFGHACRMKRAGGGEYGLLASVAKAPFGHA
jgi:hypothetical protein